MTFRIAETPSGRSRRWIRRKDRIPVPWYVRPLMTILLFILVVTMTWYGFQNAFRWRQRAGEAESISSGQPNPAATEANVWQRNVGVALDDAVRHASEGDVAQTEMAVDRATSIFTLARMRSKQDLPAEFFDTVLAQLDQTGSASQANARLSEHITLARIELAQLRSAGEHVPAGTPTSIKPEDLLLPGAAAAATNAKGAANSHSGAASSDNAAPGQVAVRAPRALRDGSTLDPGSLGGNVLDATGMPSASEILEPPSSRLFADNVRVEDLTIVGATQTLDGIHWKNVTFINTRLRYEGGELDLHNVRFIHCMFGFAPDERGARIATAIARGENTIVIE